ncbi:glycosyltransferase family 2 protein [uncultured Tateyamaria sp.]|uniref:glycosyltransferase family 2 protein n=1 Tax=uncultured Tateyamaria sp. TaxID=455651 RepID=UPI0026127B2F|nr:glycosyltransferase family 2 protein [uncultured Tateyamaria sp.]
MKFSCIMTTFDDRDILVQSVNSLLHQTHSDFELLLVDDGSGPETKAVLAGFDDPRIMLLEQSNDGLSSARNRALHHATGDYICFLDADDVRAPWALADVAAAIEASAPELIIVRGVFSGERSPLAPFLDESAMDGYEAAAAKGEMTLADRKAWAMSCEPQSANKFIARALIERGALRFPNDHFFEDILFHSAAIAHARSVEILPSRSFTYFQRQLRPQLTASNGLSRFDIIGTARVAFQLFEQHPDFAHPRIRGALSIGALRLLRWCEDTIPTYHKPAYKVALGQSLKSVNRLYLVIDPSTPDPRGERDGLMHYARERVR